jgi:hypothetical protein
VPRTVDRRPAGTYAAFIYSKCLEAVEERRGVTIAVKIVTTSYGWEVFEAFVVRTRA